MIVTNMNRKKRMRNLLIITLLILIILLSRISYIQFIKGSELKSLAYLQQTLNRSINPKRGTIYDATGKNILAISSTVETITVNPTNIKEENKEKIAKILSEIFELDYETVLKKIKKHSSIETIVKKVDKEQTDKLRVWLSENNIDSGINIDEDTKRYYPYAKLASQVIGFCGSDNQGLDGIESMYDEELKGSPGKITKLTNAKGGEILNEAEEYIDAIDGKDIISSIDMTIQSIAEKYLEEACIDNVCTDGGNVIIMNPKTGDILAMATYPNYNLNAPYEINKEELKEIWEGLSQTEKNINLQKMWRNKAIADTYEPGSTFKLITSSAALEEKITTTDKEGEFTCTGGIEIAGVRIKCWRYYRPHGAESLRKALMNSCNPVFIGLGQKIGVDKYYEYLEKFGFLNKTGVKLPGEAKGIFLDKEKVGPVELATISFGQRFEITPIQLVTAVSSIANGGIKVTPRIVKKIIDNSTNETTEIISENEERIISEETSKNVLSMMQSVVDEGTGKNARVEGYSIGGKTGTSEDGVNTNKYVTSFIGVAPISNPQVVILITLYNPTGEGGHQGGGVAAPVGGQILSEVLPYLELNKDKVLEEKIEEFEMPDLRDTSIKDAKAKLKEKGMEYEINIDKNKEIDENNVVIKEQLPKPGIKVNTKTKVYLEIN